MNNSNQYFNSIVIKAMILMLLESILIIIFSKNFTPLLFGLALGGTISIIFFKIIHLNIIYAIEKTPNKAKKIMIMNYIFRYIISGILLFVSAKSPYLNIFSCALGLITIKITIYINNVYSLIMEKKGRKTF